MGISTKGFVLTETKDVFSVLSTIESTLIRLVKKYAIKDTPIFRDSTSKFPKIECNVRGRFFSITFKVNSENRMLMVYFDCDSDYSEYSGSKIIWGVNYWGLSEEIVLGICKEMKQFGQVFYEANDFNGVVEVI
jgi:hypothetical protein